jgi:hypothetical protein
LYFALDARQKTELMIQRYAGLDQCYEQYCDRLIQIFEDLHKNKKVLALMREKLPRLEDRYNAVNPNHPYISYFSCLDHYPSPVKSVCAVGEGGRSGGEAASNFERMQQVTGADQRGK